MYFFYRFLDFNFIELVCYDRICYRFEKDKEDELVVYEKLFRSYGFVLFSFFRIFIVFVLYFFIEEVKMEKFLCFKIYGNLG